MYKIGKRIGVGTYSYVHEGLNIETKELVAVKVIKSRIMKNEVVSRLIQDEINIMKELEHPNIIKVIDDY